MAYSNWVHDKPSKAKISDEVRRREKEKVISIKINSKTTILVKPDANIDDIKERYGAMLSPSGKIQLNIELSRKFKGRVVL